MGSLMLLLVGFWLGQAGAGKRPGLRAQRPAWHVPGGVRGPALEPAHGHRPSHPIQSRTGALALQRGSAVLQLHHHLLRRPWACSPAFCSTWCWRYSTSFPSPRWTAPRSCGPPSPELARSYQRIEAWGPGLLIAVIGADIFFGTRILFRVIGPVVTCSAAPWWATPSSERPAPNDSRRRSSQTRRPPWYNGRSHTVCVEPQTEGPGVSTWEEVEPWSD